jgi:hypothetical protein
MFPIRHRRAVGRAHRGFYVFRKLVHGADSRWRYFRSRYFRHRGLGCANSNDEFHRSGTFERSGNRHDSAKIAEFKKEGKELPSLHSSKFAPVPEPTIRVGIIGMTSAVVELMKK